MMKMFSFLSSVVMLSVLAVGCSVGTTTSTKTAGSTITVSGQLAATHSVKRRLQSAKHDITGAGTTLTCSTLTNPPVTGTGVSNSSGDVTVSFDAAGKPFNCVLNAASSSDTVPLILSSGSTSGSMAVTSSDLSLGNIGVTFNGNGTIVASAALPATATVQTTTPPGLSCLAGTWSATSSYQTCGGVATSYSLFFSPKEGGGYTNSYIQNNGVVDTIHLTGTSTPGSNCISVSSTAGLAVGQAITDVSSWILNPGGQGLFGTTIASLTACGAGQIQLTDPAGGVGGAVSDHYLVTVCGTNAHNTSDVTFTGPILDNTTNANDGNTVSLTYQTSCYDVAVTNLSGGLISATSAGFIADLTPGSQCLTNLKLPTGTLGTTVITVGYVCYDADDAGYYFSGTPTIAGIPGTCSAGSFQMSAAALHTGVGLLELPNLPSGTGYSSFTFYASMTMGSDCVTPALPGSGALTGFYVAENQAALTAAAGAGITLVPATGDCASSGVPYMLSEAAGSKATTGESFVIANDAGCYQGMCFDSKGNGYSGAPTCPAGGAALTAQTEVDTLTIDPTCTNLWASQASDCTGAFDVNQSLANHCGGSQQTTSNTPALQVRALYAQTNTGCAACFPSETGATSDYPSNGCIGYGNVTCAVHGNGSNIGENVLVVKQ